MTEEELSAIPTPLKEKKITDKNGLYISIRPSGKKIFVFRFQWKTKPQTITIGRFPALSLESAREIALNFKHQVENGIDPRSNKDKVKISSVKKQYDLAAFIDSYLDYLLICAPHIPMGQLYQDLKDMYISKLYEYDVVDALQEDLQEAIKDWKPKAKRR